MLSAEPDIGGDAAMTDLEKRLARRIYNQRRRLAQMEHFDGFKNGREHLKMMLAYRRLAFERGEKIRALEAAIASALPNPLARAEG